MVPQIAASKLPSIGQRLRILSAVSAGAAGGLGALVLPAGPHVVRWAALGAASLFAACWLVLSRGVSPYLLAYLACAAALCIGMVF